MAVCMMECTCPSDLVWDDAQGCVEPPSMDDLCADSGGQIACAPIECPADVPGCDGIALCDPICDCGPNGVFDELRGCVEVPEDPTPECSYSGMGPFAGCSGSGSGAPDLSWLAALLALAALRGRRPAEVR